MHVFESLIYRIHIYTYVWIKRGIVTHIIEVYFVYLFHKQLIRLGDGEMGSSNLSYFQARKAEVLQGGHPPVLNGVITPISRAMTLSSLFIRPFKGLTIAIITIVGAHLVGKVT